MFKTLSPGSPRFQQIEFCLVLGWALLYPVKIGYSYYLGFMCLLAVFTLGQAAALKSIVLDRFSLFLVALNSVFIFGAFFSPHPFKSLLFVADIFMVSLWITLFYLEKEDMELYLRLAATVISLSSLAVIVAFVAQGGRLPVAVIFRNPILQGIASALAVLVFLHAMLRGPSRGAAALLAINFAAVLLSGSKAAFLGLAVFSAVLIFARKRKWLPVLAALLLLLVVIPNPMRRTVIHSLRHDPYVFDRLQIWSMSARMYRQHPLTGVGPDLFNEAAPRFNFAQDKGPSRYGKVPESPHSDYWKIISENGLPGLVLVLLSLLYAIRRLLSPPRFDLAKLLLGFLLAQMLLFNFVFQFFFLIVFLFLLRGFLPSGRCFVALRPLARVSFPAFAILALLLLYLFPFIADRCLDRAAREKNLVRRYGLLQKAARLSPLDQRVPLAKAALLRAFAGARSDPGAWTQAMEITRLAQRLDRNNIDALGLESELFHDARVRGYFYPAQAQEILDPLRRAAKLAPFNPFLLLRQAVVLREFGRVAEARKQAQAALTLEPDFAAAIVFIHELDGAPGDDPGLRQRLSAIRNKADRLRARAGSYLFKLHQLPETVAGQ